MARKTGPDEWPREIKRGSFTAKLYRRVKTVAGREYTSYRLSYFEGTARKLREFGDLGEAESAANDAAKALGLGRTDALSFSPQERGEFDSCQGMLAGTGKSLSDAVREYLDAMQRLPAGTTLREVADDYARRHPVNAVQVTVAAAVDDLCDDREKGGCAEAYTRKLRSNLDAFADAFRVAMASLNPPMVSDWLRSLKGSNGTPLSNRTRQNYHGSVVTLAKHAVSRRWIGRELADEIAALPMPKAKASGEVGIFAPDELARILDVAPDDIRATIAIGALAGLRTEEIHRLDWSEIKLAQGVIVVSAAKAKTASRRVVPIQPALGAWLAPLAKESGAVDPSPTSKATTHRWTRIAAKAGVQWKHNGLRHSFISYRLAMTGDPARVAFEAGNSPAMIHAHYKALVTADEGGQWFNVKPTA